MTEVPPGLADALAGRYRIEQEIGRGAGATVYRALDIRHGRAVALKLLHPDLGAALGPARFQREIRTLARLQHPHILPLFDSGEVAGRLFYTMPLVPAGSLRDRLAREGPLPVADALRLGGQLASALTCAHGLGVIHRDIKPANILLTPSGDALLVDFGIAAAAESDAARRLTETGIALGSPAYMSPEQAAGEPVDARTDVYALATVLYQALAGRPPFTGSNPRAILAARLTESPPPLSALRPDLPWPAAAAIMRGLARAAHERFESAAAFAAALTEGAAPVAPAPRRRLTRGTVVLGVALLGALGALLARGARGPASRSGSDARVLAVLPFRNLGRTEDRYFADGLTEELTGRLASLADLRVISRTSADQYAGSDKSLPDIGKELGADYLLEGSVEWEHPDSGAGRIRIRPRLVRASDDAQLWSLSYEAEPAGLLALQATVADRVRAALGLALGRGDRGGLDLGGTADVEAYDLYLRGNDYAGRGNTEGALRSAIQLYQEAVARDSAFARAWARLARVSLQIYWYHYDLTDARLAFARQAAETAARLAPDLPETHMALGFYHYWGRQDYAAAQQEFARALLGQPSNPDLLQALAYVERRRGDWPSSLEHFEAARRLDPRSGVRHFEVGDDALALHRYREAERAFEQAILLSPDWADPYVYKGWLYICWRGDFTRARALLRQALARIEPERVVVAFSSGDLPSASPATSDRSFWPLLDGVSASTFPGDQARYHIVKAEMESYRDRPAARRAHGDSAVRIASAQAALAPDDARVLNRLALALAYAGRTEEAIRTGRRVVELAPVTRDGYSGFYMAVALARIYADAGRAAEAVEVLRDLRPHPGMLSAAALRSDPAWGAIRDRPAFQALLDERLPFDTMPTTPAPEPVTER
jgi:TolB-like protein/Flp pilus assembly protein TadD/tRNA A-37 threonylcarbamoyl transferase component Bud32